MAYLVALHHDELSRIEGNLAITQRFTKALPPGVPLGDFGPQLALLTSTGTRDRTAGEPSERHLAWMGVVRRTNTVGPVDKSITIEPLRKCPDIVHIDGPWGLLTHLPDPHRSRLTKILESGDVQRCDWATWLALAQVIRERHTSTGQLLDWLAAQANPPQLANENEADRSWQEQGDALGTALRITDLPLSTFAAWRLPLRYLRHT